MGFEVKISFDPKPVEEQLMERFGEGGKAQHEWSRIVFDGSRKYMPKVTGTLENLSYAHSEPRFGIGELLYPGPYAHFLWQGVVYVDPNTGSSYAKAGVSKIPSDKELRYDRSANPMAGPRWTERAANDLYDTWVETMQGLVDRGIV